MAPESLRFGPLSGRSIHLCIDMQNLFAEETPWHTPWMKRVLPVVAEIAERHAERTIFTRFIPPATPKEAPGSWRRYWERWDELTLKRLDHRLLNLVPRLSGFVPPAEVVDKRYYSPFHGTGLAQRLRERDADALVISGAETDMCVLATVLDAIDLGYRVVLATDALCSSSDTTHDALLTLYHDRFSQQIEAVEAEVILSAWTQRMS